MLTHGACGIGVNFLVINRTTCNKSLEMFLLFDPLISLPGIYPKIITRISHKDVYDEAHRSIFLVKKNWKMLMSNGEMFQVCFIAFLCEVYAVIRNSFK